MLILTIRTDRPEAELDLFHDQQKIASETWPAHRELAETIHQKINELLKTKDKTLYDINGVVCFAGPGSFTGLRIGLSVGNALAMALDCPIVAANNEDWQQTGIAKLQAGQNDRLALPQYGSPVHITAPKR